MDGDPNQLLVRIGEGDDDMCDVCAGLEGETGTIAYHESIGLPGAATCLGGDACRCDLVPYDER